jgi:hypothetical protein
VGPGSGVQTTDGYWLGTAVRRNVTGCPDRRKNQFVRIEGLVVLDFEIAEEMLTGFHHQRVEQVGRAQPSVDGIEVVPYADDGDLLAPVGADLACDLGVDESRVGPRTFERPQGPDPEEFDILGRDPTLEDPDYQELTRERYRNPRAILRAETGGGNNRAISSWLDWRSSA